MRAIAGVVGIMVVGVVYVFADLKVRSAPEETAATIRVGFARPGGGYTIASVPLETYVARVLAGEAARDSAPAALDALAIAIRTFALANRSRHRADGFDLCSETHCQVVRTATGATEASAARTIGRILVAGGLPASIYYTASCGGFSEMPSAVWPGAPDPPFLPSKPDLACRGGPSWQTEIADDDLLRALHAAGFQGGRLRALRIVARDGSGRAARLRLDGLTPGEISGQDLRVAVGRTLGWQRIKSTSFDVARERRGYRLTGRGAGHGVGLCVIGSVHLAAAGESAEEILGRYFPGLQIGAARGPTPSAASPATGHAPAENTAGILLTLPDEDEGDRASIAAAVLRARDEVAPTLGLAPPASIVVRVHATVSSFEQATGRPWFASGSIVGRELHLVPIASLRERGVLDRTIRREVVHLMVDSELARRPLWVRDGAAIYFADPHDASTEGRLTCPDDRELANPASPGALVNAYARARACFARQIAAGKKWREVR